MNDVFGAGAECFVGNTSRKHNLSMGWLMPPTPIAHARIGSERRYASATFGNTATTYEGLSTQ